MAGRWFGTALTCHRLANWNHCAVSLQQTYVSDVRTRVLEPGRRLPWFSYRSDTPRPRGDNQGRVS
jgi:hypothetical protein